MSIESLVIFAVIERLAHHIACFVQAVNLLDARDGKLVPAGIARVGRIRLRELALQAVATPRFVFVRLIVAPGHVEVSIEASLGHVATAVLVTVEVDQLVRLIAEDAGSNPAPLGQQLVLHDVLQGALAQGERRLVGIGAQCLIRVQVIELERLDLRFAGIHVRLLRGGHLAR